MERTLPFFLRFTSLVFLLFCGNTLANILTPQEIATKTLDATVLIVMEDANGEIIGFGSGFFVQQNQIATNYHVIEGATTGTAKQVGQEIEFKITSFSVIDETLDLAIIEVSDSGVLPLPLGDSDDVVIGDTVYVAGNPRGYLEGTFSHGLVSAIRELSTRTLLQITAPISSGSSGGPVLDNKGEVIGVSVAQIKDGQNLNFAIPSNYLNSIISYKNGKANYWAGLYQLSIEYYDAALRLNPDHARVYTWRGIAKYELGQQNAAMQDFYDKLRLNIRLPLNYARRKTNMRKLAHEISDYHTAIQQNPDNALAYFGRASVYSRSEEYDTALADCDTAIRLLPNFALAYCMRGLVKHHLEHRISAIQDFDNAIRLNPDFAIFYYQRANAKASFGNYSDAIKDFDVAIQLQPDYALAYSIRGVTKAHLGQQDAAIIDCDKAIQLQPTVAYVYIARGSAKLNLRRHSAAIKDFDTAIQLEPEYADTYVDRGTAKANLGQSAAAILDYGTAIQLKPDYPLAYYNRGTARSELQQYSDAIKDFDSAIRLKPDYADAYANRGVAKLNLRRYKAAIQDFDTAIGLQPDNALAYYNRGLSKYDLGYTLAAKQDFQTALKFAEWTGDKRTKSLAEDMIREY